jgi:hypothetical protein
LLIPVSAAGTKNEKAKNTMKRESMSDLRHGDAAGDR